ncbi:hypothetical protein D3C86_1443820 [compost metagenome]
MYWLNAQGLLYRHKVCSFLDVQLFDCIYNKSLLLIWYITALLSFLHIDTERCNSFCPGLIEHDRFALLLQKIGI